MSCRSRSPTVSLSPYPLLACWYSARPVREAGWKMQTRSLYIHRYMPEHSSICQFLWWCFLGVLFCFSLLQFTVTPSGEKPVWKNDIAGIPVSAGSHSSEGLDDAAFSPIKHITFRFTYHVLCLVVAFGKKAFLLCLFSGSSCFWDWQ